MPFNEPPLCLIFADERGKEVRIRAEKQVEIYRRDGPLYQIVFVVDGKEQDVNLHDATISRKKEGKAHLVLFVKDNKAYAVDSGSKSGTFLHAHQLPPDIPEQVYHEDIIRVGGNLKVKVELAESMREVGFETIVAPSPVAPSPEPDMSASLQGAPPPLPPEYDVPTKVKKPGVPVSLRCLKCDALIKSGETPYQHECGAAFHQACARRMASDRLVCMECGEPIPLSALSTPVSGALSTGVSEQGGMEPGKVCQICNQPIGDRAKVVCGCGRVYHSSCFREKYNNMCPYCSQQKEEEVVLCGICQKEIPRTLQDKYKVVCKCGAVYHRSCANRNIYCINCNAMVAVEGETDSAKLMQKASGQEETGTDRTKKPAKCKICLGIIKQGIPIFECKCGRTYHLTCAERVGECPGCGRAIKLD